MELVLDKINKSFGSNHVLKDLGFTARSGSAFGLLGRNGSGKTTTIRIIMDIFPQDSGTVSIDGKSMSKFDGKIGYLPEERGLYPKRVILEQMVYIGELRGMKASDAKKRAEMLLEKLDAGEYLKKKLDTLSKGNQQKIQLAIALINNPDILILDEPFSGLDPVNAKVLKDLVSEMVREGKMVLFSSHQMGNVEEFCDDVCIINKGEIVLEGNLKKIKKSYPRNRVLVTPENDDLQAFARRIENEPSLKGVVTGAALDRRGCIVTLKNPDDKRRLFSAFDTMGIEMDSFRILEPSLEEIFLEKAGGENASV